MRNVRHGGLRRAGIPTGIELDKHRDKVPSMTTNDESTGTARTPATKRKPYEKPSFRNEKVFVTTALSCGKTPNSSFQCNTNPKVS
jgi:hypothetical protein